MKKDTTGRALRLATRNALISAIFYELTTQEGFVFMQAYLFLEEIFRIDERQIRKILRQHVKVELSSDNLTKLAVILQRILISKLFRTRSTFSGIESKDYDI